MATIVIATIVIATNVIGSLHGRLRGRRCRPFNSDMKIRVRLPTEVRFYYPDVSVVCRSNPQGESFQDEPVVDFVIQTAATHGIPGLVNLYGIDSPGLTSCLALADLVAAGLDGPRN